jgi:hypothetical protein
MKFKKQSTSPDFIKTIRDSSVLGDVREVKIASVEILYPGSGYSSSARASFSGPFNSNGRVAEGKIILDPDGGGILAVEITLSGSGYINFDLVSLTIIDNRTIVDPAIFRVLTI